MDLHHLRYFVAVADERNVTRAAARLHMATSPLSRRVRDLERELGTPLFVRLHRRLELTPAGAELLPRARDVVERFDALRADARRAAGDRERGEPGPPARRRPAAVGMAPDVAPEVRGAFLDAVRTAHPDVDVRIHPDNSAPLVRAVLARDLDLAFVHGRVDAPELTSIRVDSRPAGVAIAAGGAFDGRASVRLGELADLPYASISHDAAPAVYAGTDALLTRHGVRRRVVLDSHNPGDLAPIVAAGQAFTFVGLTAGLTHKAFLGEPVVVLPVDGVDVRLTTDAVWRADRTGPDDVVTDLAAAVTAGPL